MTSIKKLEIEIMDIHASIKEAIESSLREFRWIWENGSDQDLFRELVFCLLTPQSGARRCWRAVENLAAKDLLLKGNFDEIRQELNIVRFMNNKAGYILEARFLFFAKRGGCIRQILSDCGDVPSMRNFLFKNVKGMGCKEASHYLRNIGLGCDIAILDRHILRNMHKLGLIDEIPKTLSPGRYRSIEMLLKGFSVRKNLPLDHLDFVLWYKETGDIFK